MSSTALFLICVWALGNVAFSHAMCTLSTYEEGHGNMRNWIKCSNASISMALKKGGAEISSIMISMSRIPYVPENAFSKYRKSLRSINLHNCGVREIHPDAFEGLSSLEKLSLPNNNISEVNHRWFQGLISLEQLDLSFNAIRKIDASVFAKLANLRRLNLNENDIACLEPRELESMRSIAKIRIEGNRLAYQCRAKLTRWFADRGINYKSELARRESNLDSVLWHCASDDATIEGSEILMKECVLLNLYNQLQSALASSDSYTSVVSDCVNERNVVAACLKRVGNSPATNGRAVRHLLTALAKSY